MVSPSVCMRPHRRLCLKQLYTEQGNTTNLRPSPSTILLAGVATISWIVTFGAGQYCGIKLKDSTILPLLLTYSMIFPAQMCVWVNSTTPGNLKKLLLSVP